MSNLNKKYAGDVVAELLAEGEYESAGDILKALSDSVSIGRAVDELHYANPENRDRVFVGIPIVLCEIQDGEIRADDVERFSSERLSDNE